MKKISVVGIISLILLLVAPLAAAEGKGGTHIIHAVAGGNCKIFIHYGLGLIPPAVTSESEFILASQGEVGEFPTIRTGMVSAAWTTVEDGETVEYEIEMIVKAREETLVTQIETGGLYGDWPGTYLSSARIVMLDVEGFVRVDGQ